MENNLIIYRLKHRAGGDEYPDLKYLLDLQVGSSLTNEDVCELKDNTGDNISHLNQIFLETTGHYWVWKNAKKSNYVGFEHYRRHINLNENNILYLLKKFNIIALTPINVMNVKKQYEYCHSIIDLKIIKQIIFDLYPEYKESWNIYIENGKIIIPCNSFITKWEIFDNMWTFIINVLFEFQKRLNLKTIEDFKEHVINTSNKICPPDHIKSGLNWVDYQMRIFGSLTERLITLFILHNFKDSVFYSDYIKGKELPSII